jgi:glycosyltransferase involved in cell wall biosynthesis
VPARNEEETIEQSLTTLLHLDYSNHEIIAVNDRSTDRTGEMMEKVAATPAAHDRLRLIQHNELPSGWMGKTHAMWTAANQASGDWLLFTDADVLFKPDSLRRAMAYAESQRADHVVLFPRMIMDSVGERMMIAFFQTMFVFGHRPWKVADPKTRDHIGVGAFNLVRRSVYQSVGTYEALRMEVLDDMKLGKVVKNAGFAQRNVFGEDLISVHWARGAKGVMNNLTKNFFAVLSFQWPRTLVSAFGMAFLNLMPFVGVCLAHGWARLPYAIALLSMFLIYWGMSRCSAIPAYYFLLHPVSSVLFVYTLLRSMAHTLWNDGIVWRGTKYHLEELRKGMV